jgi:hypothetical protein
VLFNKTERFTSIPYIRHSSLYVGNIPAVQEATRLFKIKKRHRGFSNVVTNDCRIAYVLLYVL